MDFIKEIIAIILEKIIKAFVSFLCSISISSRNPVISIDKYKLGNDTYITLCNQSNKIMMDFKVFKKEKENGMMLMNDDIFPILRLDSQDIVYVKLHEYWDSCGKCTLCIEWLNRRNQKKVFCKNLFL